MSVSPLKPLKKPSAVSLSKPFARFAESCPPIAESSFIPISDPTFGQVVGGHFDLHAVAGKNAYEIFAHLAADLRQHDMFAVIQTNAEESVGQFVYDHALGWNQIIFSQTKSPLVKSSAAARVWETPPERFTRSRRMNRT
jgi:hypothetical protein